MKPTLQILEDARKLIEKPEAWTHELAALAAVIELADYWQRTGDAQGINHRRSLREAFDRAIAAEREKVQA